MTSYRGLLKEHSSVLNAALHVLDWGAVAVAGWAAHDIYLGSWDLAPSYSIVVGIVVLLAALLFPRFRLYQAWRGASIFDEIRAITLAWTLVLFLLFGFAFTTKMGVQFSRGWVGIWAILGWLLLVCDRILLRIGLRWLRSHGFNQRRIVIVGTEGVGEEVARRLLAIPSVGLQVEGFFGIDAALNGGRVVGLPVLGNLQDVAAYVAGGRIDQVWIALPLKEQDKVESLLHDLRHIVVDIRLVPDIFSFRLLNHSVSEVAGLPVLDLSATPMVGMSRLIKALEDRLLASLILLLISPLMVFIALGVKLSSPGPVLFKQKRLGWDGRAFIVYKFRSMVIHEENDGRVTQASKGDARITAFGALLRRTSLDELPQFLNVLQGSMSIVGPRPHAIEHNEQYKDLIDDYMLRHKVKPGITGWAQINGWRGETDTVEKMRKRVEYDLYYIEHWSLWFDLRIILLTVLKGFINKNAY